MRQEDRLEWYYSSGHSFGLTSVSELQDALCLYDDETHKVYAIGAIEGVTIWVVCTTEVDKHPIKFLRFCKPFFKEWVKHPVTCLLYTSDAADSKGVMAYVYPYGCCWYQYWLAGCR